jgi:hypothetical protein
LDHPASPSRLVLRLAGSAYDSFTSHEILDEAADVLARPSFAAPADRVRHLLDEFLRASRQVFTELVPGIDAGAVRGDVDDLPVLKTASAVYVSAPEYPEVITRATEPGGGFFLVSENTSDFVPGRHVHGFAFVRAGDFLNLLLARSAAQR